MTELNNNQIYQTMTRVTHRDLAPLVGTYADLLNNDPNFISRALVHIASTSKINDQVMAAIVTLLQADPEYPEFREAGRALALGQRVYQIDFHKEIDGLEAFQLIRVLDYIRKSDRPITRQARKIAIDWVNSLMANPALLDAVSIQNRKSLTWLIKYFYVPTNQYVSALLFSDTPPEGSKIAALKMIVAETDPVKKAEMVMKHKIPYRIAVSILPKVDAAIGLALLSRMSPQEALNSRSWIERSGLFAIPEVKAHYLKLIASATKSVATLQKRKSTQGSDAEINAAIQQTTEKAVQQGQRIAHPPVIIGDQSGSQEVSIATTRETVPIIVAASDEPVNVFMYNTSATQMEFSSQSLTQVQRDFSKLRATGGTLVHVALRKAHDKGVDLTNVVWIGDLHESNTTEAYKTFRELGVQNLSIIQLPSSEHGNPSIDIQVLEDAGIRVVHYDLTTTPFDPYIGDAIVGWFAGDKTRNIADIIADTELPKIVGYSF